MFDALAAGSTLRFVAKAKRLAKNVRANLGLGEPDKNPPKRLLEHLLHSMQEKPTYTPSAGLMEARKAVAEWLSSRYSTEVAPEEVMITPSGKAALYLALLYASSLKDKAVLHDPTYYSYEPVLRSASLKIKKVRMERDEDTYVFPEEFVNAERESVIVVNSPSNPTGAVLGERMLELIDNALKKDSLVISDEAYDVFVYEGQHVSLLQHERWREAGLFVYSFSKVLCVPGWRLGAIVAREDIIRKLSSAASNVYGCPCKWEQLALARYLSEDSKDLEEHVKRMVEDYSKRRETVRSKLKDIAIFTGLGPGAFYAFPEFERDGEELALEAAKRGVIVIPGSIFSETYGKRSLRISYSAPPSELEEGLKVLKELLEER